MIINLFYILGIFAIMWEGFVLTNMNRIYFYREESLKKIKQKNLSSITYNERLLHLFIILYSIWTIVGLFSSHFYCFLLINILSLFDLSNNKKTYLRFLDALISLIILIFIFLNKFILDINISEFLKTTIL